VIILYEAEMLAIFWTIMFLDKNNDLRMKNPPRVLYSQIRFLTETKKLRTNPNEPSRAKNY
jgi:hypothetical protein